MENQNELQSNYVVLKNQSAQYQCPQSTKCTVDGAKISAALNAYHVKFQNLSSDKVKYQILKDNISKVISEAAITTHQRHFQNGDNPWTAPATEAAEFVSQEDTGNRVELPPILANAEAEIGNSTEETYSNHDSTISSEPSNLGHSKPQRASAAEDSVARPFQCSECDKAFKRNLHLKRHFVVSHTSKKNFSCSDCGKSFSRKDYLDKHVGTHEKKKFKLKLLEQGIVVRTKMHVKSPK